MDPRRIAFVGLVAALLLSVSPSSTAHAQQREPASFQGIYANGGVGIPELGHAEVGYFLLDRLSLEAQYKWSIFNHLIGLGGSYHFWGVSRPDSPPRYSAIVGASALVNPTLGGLQLESRGDEIGAAAIAHVGFMLVSDSGLMFRALGGPMFFDDPGSIVHPSFHIGAGWMF